MLFRSGSHHIEEALRALASHRSYFTTRAGEILFDRMFQEGKRNHKSSANALTAREREIVQLVTEGLSNKEAAARLGISEKTIETHRATVMRKLKLKSFSDLVRYAIRNHITSL